jgi:hypothetical protein
MEDRAFVKSDLKRIGLIFIGIFILFGILYYLEANFSALTKLLP